MSTATNNNTDFPTPEGKTISQAFQRSFLQPIRYEQFITFRAKYWVGANKAVYTFFEAGQTAATKWIHTNNNIQILDEPQTIHSHCVFRLYSCEGKTNGTPVKYGEKFNIKSILKDGDQQLVITCPKGLIYCDAGGNQNKCGSDDWEVFFFTDENGIAPKDTEVKFGYAARIRSAYPGGNDMCYADAANVWQQPPGTNDNAITYPLPTNGSVYKLASDDLKQYGEKYVGLSCKNNVLQYICIEDQWNKFWKFIASLRFWVYGILGLLLFGLIFYLQNYIYASYVNNGATVLIYNTVAPVGKVAGAAGSAAASGLGYAGRGVASGLGYAGRGVASGLGTAGRGVASGLSYVGKSAVKGTIKTFSTDARNKYREATIKKKITENPELFTGVDEDLETLPEDKNERETKLKDIEFEIDNALKQKKIRLKEEKIQLKENEKILNEQIKIEEKQNKIKEEQNKIKEEINQFNKERNEYFDDLIRKTPPKNKKTIEILESKKNKQLKFVDTDIENTKKLLKQGRNELANAKRNRNIEEFKEGIINYGGSI
jgi:hypothetical protein